jgi:hypothetical protein
MLGDIYARYPRLSGHDFNVIDSRGSGLLHPRNIGGGKLEFYAPGEEYNPAPGRPTIEVFDPSLRGKRLKKAVFGDMLHHLPAVDPAFRSLRADFRRTVTDKQLATDRRAHKRARDEHGETRSFDDWFEQSRLDAYIRGFLAPDERDEWAGSYTAKQIGILQKMKGLLGRPRPTGGLLSR